MIATGAAGSDGVVGWILMVAGALWLVILLALYQRRRSVRTTVTADRRPAARRTDVIEEPDPPDPYGRP